MDDLDRQFKQEKLQINKKHNNQKTRSRNEAQMINQLFNSVKKSEKAIEDTLKSIDATLEFIKKIDDKTEYSTNKLKASSE